MTKSNATTKIEKIKAEETEETKGEWWKLNAASHDRYLETNYIISFSQQKQYYHYISCV